MIRKWSVRGGNERVATEVARQLVLRGHEVLVICQKVDASMRDADFEVGLVTLSGLSFDPTLAMLGFAWSARRYVRRLRERGEVDIVLGFNHSVEQDVYRLGGGTHAAYLAQQGGGSRHPILDRAALRLEQARFRSSGLQRLIAPSQFVKSEILEHYDLPADAIRVVPNGIDLVRFDPDRESIEEARDALDLPRNGPLALFVGQDLVRKGFDVARRAAAEVGVPLVYVGPARRPDGLGTKVHWLGERRDVERAYTACDVLLLPSHYDPFGGVVLEAYASGRPAVATRRVGATELARGSALESLLVESPEDLESVIAALEVALSRPRQGWREDARACSETRNLEAFGREVEAVLLDR